MPENGDRWGRRPLHPGLPAGCWGGAELPLLTVLSRESGVGVRTKATEEAELARTLPCGGWAAHWLCRNG